MKIGIIGDIQPDDSKMLEITVHKGIVGKRIVLRMTTFREDIGMSIDAKTANGLIQYLAEAIENVQEKEEVK